MLGEREENENVNEINDTDEYNINGKQICLT